MRISIPGKNRDTRAFTLIELSVVLFLISLIIWTALPRLSVLSGEEKNDFLRKAAAHLENTMEEAIFLSRGGKIEIDFSEGVIENYTGTGDEKEKLWSIRAPGSLLLESVTTNFGRTYTEERVYIPYSPMGFIPGTKIFLRGTRDRRIYTIKVNSFTGKVDITDEPEEERS